MPSEQPKWSKTCSFLDRSCGKRSTCGSIRQDQGLLSASAASHNFLKSQYYFFNRLLKLLVSNRVFEMNPTSIFHYPKGFLATIRRLKSKSIRKKIFIPGLQNIAYSSFTNIRHIFFLCNASAWSFGLLTTSLPVSSRRISRSVYEYRASL